MLNLSPRSVSSSVEQLRLESLNHSKLPTSQRMFRRWTLAILLIGVLFLFLPWVQNFRAKGMVTAFDPEVRPQTIQSTIPGRVEAWYVFEGDSVVRGDTIVRLSETKPEYLDPQLVERTGATRDAKSSSAGGYLAKAQALERQAVSLEQEQEFKLRQAQNKLEQSRGYVAILEAELAQQEAELEVATYQLERADSLYRRGLKSLTDQEGKRLKVQETRAKLTSTQNKLAQAQTDIRQASLAIEGLAPEYAGKLAKVESDRQSALTDYYTAVGDVAKLTSQEAGYRIRRGYNYITAPQNGIVSKIRRPGIGETVKEGEEVVSILPSNFEAAVEIYVEPFNLPLVQLGEDVRLLFDGWPAIVFSGWPGASYGTFVGRIAAVDNIIDEKGRYRVLVTPSLEGKSWPKALRPGSGAEGVVLLNRVPVWYEFWRQLNAFPPDYYQGDGPVAGKETAKRKAPAKAVAK